MVSFFAQDSIWFLPPALLLIHQIDKIQNDGTPLSGLTMVISCDLAHHSISPL
jgi:hypothetical protein